MLGDTPVLRETLRRLADTGVSVLDVEFLRFEPETPIGVPGGLPRGRGAPRREVRARDERRAGGGAHARSLRRALRSRGAVRPARLPGVRDLHRCEDPRARRAHGEAVGPPERLDPGGRAALQPVRAACRPTSRTIDPSLFRYAQICDAAPGMPTDAPELIREARTGRLLPGEGVLPLRGARGGAACDHAAERRGAGACDRRSPRARACAARVPGDARAARQHLRRASWRDASQAKWQW